MNFLFSIPAGVEIILLAAYALLLIYTIAVILRNEQQLFSRIIFILLALFIPFFMVGYLVYAGLKKKEAVS